MFLQLFSKIKPSVSIKLFYGYFMIVLLYKFIFKSIYGFLLLSTAFYWYVDEFTELCPFNGLQLLNWFVFLDTEYKTAIFTSIVTISGFVIAFYAATLNWKHQMRAQIMYEISKEIDDFFLRAERSNSIIKIHAKKMIDAASKIKGKSIATLEEAEFLVDNNVKDTAKFLEARDNLVNASINVHRMIARHYIVLITNVGALDHAKMFADSLQDIVQKIYIDLPYVRHNDPIRVNQFVQQVNMDRCAELVEVCEKAETVISATAGALRGQLQNRALGVNSRVVAHMFKNHEHMRKFAEDIYK
ncbi:MAG: hypothetical protein N0C86_06375 [Candidatus Thiodiazotropha taylori]|nr:hypothetical protein [Candidatus Thiodiazotropha taylori]MCG8071593.1 hypothetical protein [Candidatus Thiodiazotropha taylori]MCW4320681.1 hypothetical protein [Candidatus Thiodiazotropha taylori]MCW4325607.1 hypothetical protein [Candidatus Thiodiazotropha taylori]